MPFRCPICKRISFSSQKYTATKKGYDNPFLTLKICMNEQCLRGAYDLSKRANEILYPSEESE